MATWRNEGIHTTTTLVIETHEAATNVMIDTSSRDTGKTLIIAHINIPLSTLKEMVEAQ